MYRATGAKKFAAKALTQESMESIEDPISIIVQDLLTKGSAIYCHQESPIRITSLQDGI